MNTIMELHEKIHNFENSKQLLEYKLGFQNVPVWPLVRVSIVISCIDKKVAVFRARKREQMTERENELKEFTIRNPFFSLPKDVIYIGFPNDDMLRHEDGLIYDERIKAYMDVNQKSSMLVSVITKDEFEYAYQNWRSDYFIHYLARKKEKESKDDLKMANEFIRYLKNNFPLEIDSALSKTIFNTIMEYSRWLSGYVETWKKYLKIVRPSLVVECDGCYMSILYVAMNLACNNLNIPTAEIQHAWEGKTSHAHYWGEAIIRNNDCKRIFPDYFFTMGKYWNTQVNVPSKKIVIGTHRKYYRSIERKDSNVLICLSGAYETYVDLVETIINSTDLNTKVYLRIHPIENTQKIRNLFSKFETSNRFQFANEKKLEFYFEQCTYVVSSGSTVIYEALTCGKVVFVPKDIMYEWYGLDSIKDKIYLLQDPQQFKELWNRRHELKMKVYNDFYDMNYKRLYGGFINRMKKRKRKGR